MYALFMKKHFTLVLGILFAAALCLRLIVCWQLSPSPEVASPNIQSDMATYLRLASEIRQGQFPDHFDYQPFYYTVVLPLLVPASGSKAFLLIFQALAGAGCVYLAGLCAAMVFGRRFAWVAALLLALARFHIFYTPFALYEVLQSFWTVLLCYLTLLSWRHNRVRHWLLSAVVLACAILTRGNALLFLPILLLAVILRNWHGNRARGLILAACLAVVAMVPQLPFALRNYQYAGRWVGASTAAGKVLILGNSPEAPAAGLAYPQTYSDWTGLHDAHTQSALKSILKWVSSQPLSFLELKFRTLLHFWDAAEVPNNVNIDAHGYPFSPLLGMPFLLDFGIFAPLGLAGLLLCLFRRSPRKTLLASYMLVFMAATVAFYMLARFRIAAVPLLCILAAGTVSEIGRLASSWNHLEQKRRQKQLFAVAGALVFAVFTVHGALFIYRFGYESSIITALTPAGTCIHVTSEGTMLVHDHGPLPMGVGGAMPALADSSAADRLVIRKTFLVPQVMYGLDAGKTVTHPFQARILVSPDALKHGGTVTVTHGDETVTAVPRTLYAFNTFLCADFKNYKSTLKNTWSPYNAVDVIFTFEGPIAACAMSDMLRWFGRTQFTLEKNGSSTVMPLEAEAFAELSISTVIQ